MTSKDPKQSQAPVPLGVCCCRRLYRRRRLAIVYAFTFLCSLASLSYLVWSLIAVRRSVSVTPPSPVPGADLPRIEPLQSGLLADMFHLHDTAGFSNTVLHFAWCGYHSRPFDFVNYISLLSAVRYLGVQKLEFYYVDTPPEYNGYDYFTHSYYRELRALVPGMHEVREPLACNEDTGRPNIEFINAEILTKNGGIFIEERTLITAPPSLELRQNDILDAWNYASNSGLIAVRENLPQDTVNATLGALSVSDRTIVGDLTVTHVSCASSHREVHDFVPVHSSSSKSAMCMSIEDSLEPSDIWELDNAFGRTVRSIFYGSPEMRRPVQSFRNLSPNVGHLIWWDELPFFVYLSLLSMIHVAKLDKVYVHGPQPPTGPYWQRLESHSPSGVLQWKHHELSNEVSGRLVVNVAHVTDLWRPDIMLSYGGVYIDADALFVKPLSKDIRAYDAVMPAHILVQHDGQVNPHGLYNSMLVGRPGAAFWRRFKASLVDFRDDLQCANGCLRAMQLKQRHPELLRIEPGMQATCGSEMWKCWDGWGRPIDTGGGISWRNVSFVYHMTYPDVPQFVSPRDLLSSTGFAAELGKFVLQSANELEYISNISNQQL